MKAEWSLSIKAWNTEIYLRTLYELQAFEILIVVEVTTQKRLILNSMSKNKIFFRTCFE